MPQVVTEYPVLTKLDETLFDGHFVRRFWTDAMGAPTGAYYVFHDGTWMADLRHLLGWSREAINLLTGSNWMKHFFKPKALRADWLYGHAFQWMGDGTYRLSNTPARYTIPDFINKAHYVHDMLERADIHTDQWGATDKGVWREAITKEADIKCHPGINPRGYQLLRDLRENRDDAEFHAMMANYGNAHYHPFYPISGPTMASGIGQTECNTILNSRFENSASTGPATIYAALHSANPSDTSQGTEAVYTSYARIAITANTTNFPAASAGAITCQFVITWATNTGSTETEVAMSFQSASSGGTQPMYWGTFASQAIANGNTPQANAGAVTVSGV